MEKEERKKGTMRRGEKGEGKKEIGKWDRWKSRTRRGIIERGRRKFRKGEVTG